MPRLLFTPGKDPVPIVQEAGWASETVWTGAKNLVPTGIQPQTIQPIVSRYTDYTTRPRTYSQYAVYILQYNKCYGRDLVLHQDGGIVRCHVH